MAFSTVKAAVATAALTAAISAGTASAAFADEATALAQPEDLTGKDAKGATANNANATQSETILSERSGASVSAIQSASAQEETKSLNAAAHTAASVNEVPVALNTTSAVTPLAQPTDNSSTTNTNTETSVKAQAGTEKLEVQFKGEIQSFISLTQTKAQSGWKNASDTSTASNTNTAKPASTATQASKTSSAGVARTTAKGSVFVASASAGGSAGGGIVNNPAGGLDLVFQVKDGNDYVDFFDYLRDHPEIQVSKSSAQILTKDGTNKNHGLDFTWFMYRFHINDLPAVQPNAVGRYQVKASITLSNGQVLEALSNVFAIYPKDITFADIVAENETNRKSGEQNEWFVSVPYLTTLNGLGLAENKDATAEQKKAMATFAMPDGKTWINGSGEDGVYSEVGNATNTDSEQLVIKSGSNVTFNNMKFNSSVRIVVEKGATLTLRHSVVFGKLEVHGTLNAKDGSTVTDTIYLRDGATLEDAKITSHARYLTDGNYSKPEVDVVVVSDGQVTIKGNVTIEGDYGSSARQGQTAFVITSGKVTLADGAVLKVTGGDTDLIYAQDGGDGLLMANGTELAGNGKVIATGGISKLATAGSGVAVATIDTKGNITKGEGTAKVSVTSLTATGGDSAEKGDAHFPYARTKQAGDGIGKGIDASGTTVVNATAGSGENAGQADASGFERTIATKPVTGASSFVVNWGIDEGSTVKTQGASAQSSVQITPKDTGVDYTGYKLTFGIFDETGTQIGSDYTLAYGGEAVTISDIDATKSYIIKVLGMTNASGKEVASDFQTNITTNKQTVKGPVQNVWKPHELGLKAGDSGVLITYESNGQTYALGKDENSNLIAQAFNPENSTDVLGDRFKWDIEEGSKGFFEQTTDKIRLSIHGEDTYLSISYLDSGYTLCLETFNQWVSSTKYDFVLKDGMLQGSGYYLAGNGAKPGQSVSQGSTIGVWSLQPGQSESTTITFNVQSTPQATYTVTWLNHDGTELARHSVKHGARAMFSLANPTKAEDENFTYTFAGWDKTPSAVTENTTYQAMFTAVPKEQTPDPTDPGTNPSTDPTEPGIDPSTDPAEPGTNPTNPVSPVDPGVDPDQDNNVTDPVNPPQDNNNDAGDENADVTDPETDEELAASEEKTPQVKPTASEAKKSSKTIVHGSTSKADATPKTADTTAPGTIPAVFAATLGALFATRSVRKRAKHYAKHARR